MCDLPRSTTEAIGGDLAYRAAIAGQSALSYRTLVALNSSELETRGQRFKLTAGMQVSAEINLGTRTVLQYLLSPIQKNLHEAWRES